MKKFFTLVMVSLFALNMAAEQYTEEQVREMLGSKVSYVPNKFKDNWELGLGVGLNWNMDGMIERTVQVDPSVAVNLEVYKWFNPYWGVRFGLNNQILHNNFCKNAYDAGAVLMSDDDIKKAYQYYVHTDLMWNLTNQFCGYKAERMYNAVLYLHAGVSGMAGWKSADILPSFGPGFLNRFRINDNWVLNLDLRGTFHKELSANRCVKVAPGVGAGIGDGTAGELELSFGFSYRFNQATWNTYVPASDEAVKAFMDMQDSNNLLAQQKEAEAKKAAQLREENEELKRALAAAETAKQSVLADLRQVTLFYEINKSDLAIREQKHLDCYLSVIKSIGIEGSKFEVIGCADKKTGNRIYNEKLAAKRAETIKKALIEMGVKEENIICKTEIRTNRNQLLDRAAEIHFIK